MSIVIIDYGTGNILSVKRKLQSENVDVIVSNDKKVIAQADKLVLPGVGHFSKAMENLEKLNLLEVLNEQVINKKIPVLGICLGMQLMAKYSEEGNCKGLNWFDAKVVRFEVQDSLKYKVPHIGWNVLSIAKESKLVEGLPESPQFYFVHSYHIVCNNESDVLCYTIYEERFCSAIQRENLYGVQFHPEKSHDVGKIMLLNFLNV